jgi:hypothetical protein
MPKLNAALKERKEWANNHDHCWICERQSYHGFPLETHEIERKSHGVQGTWATPENYFRACKKCHMDDLATMPHPKQLAFKYLYDQGNFNRESWLRIRDAELRAPNRVTQEEIETYISQLKDEGHPKKWKS